MTAREGKGPKEERHVLKRSRLLALAAAGVLAMGGLAACGDDDDDGGGNGGGGGGNPALPGLGGGAGFNLPPGFDKFSKK